MMAEVSDSGDSFFVQLRKLCVQLEKGVPEVQKLVNSSSGRRRSDDNSNALLLLRDLQKEVSSLKSDCRKLNKEIQNDDGFMNAVPLCKKMVQIQGQRLAALEEHLSHYGYVPLQKPVATVKTDITPNKTSADSGAEETPCGLQNICTPATLRRESGDSDSTPKLEDFGLSSDFLEKKYGHIDSFKLPAPPRMEASNSSQQDCLNASMAKWDGVPALFHHSGLTVTPGLYGGKMISTVTPLGMSSKILERQEMRKHSGPIPMDRLDSCSSDHTQDGSMDDMSSPVPPVLCTPGAKLMTKPTSTITQHLSSTEQHDADINSPVPPVLMTPGFKLHTASAMAGKQDAESVRSRLQELTTAERSPEKSPVPPTLATPGFQRLIKHPKDTKSHIANDGEVDSPVMPELTTVFSQATGGDIEQPEAPKLGSSSDDIDDMEMPQMPQLSSYAPQRTYYSEAPSSSLLQSQPPVSTHTAPLATTDEDMPLAPVLTYNPKGTFGNGKSHEESRELSGKMQHPDQGMKAGYVEDMTMLLPPGMNHQTWSGEDDEEMPPPPELTCRLNFTDVHDLSMPMQPVMTHHQRDKKDVDEDLPPQPELTSKFSFSDVTDEAMPLKPVFTQKYSPQDVETPTPPTLSSYSTKNTKQEFDQLRQIQPPATFCHSYDTLNKKENRVGFLDEPTMDMQGVLDPITEGEYNRLKSFTRREYSRFTINKVINKINMVLNTRLMEGLEPELCEGDLKPDLGSSTRMLLLTMIDLNRLQQVTRNGKTCFAVV